MQAHQDYKYYRFDEAFMKYALLAELGYEVAQSNAAFLLDRNEVSLFKDRQEDLIRAFHYWKRAAAQGYSAAQVKLGDYYYYGFGTQTDYETAASLYRYKLNFSVVKQKFIFFQFFFLKISEKLQNNNTMHKQCLILVICMNKD